MPTLVFIVVRSTCPLYTRRHWDEMGLVEGEAICSKQLREVEGKRTNVKG